MDSGRRIHVPALFELLIKLSCKVVQMRAVIIAASEIFELRQAQRILQWVRRIRYGACHRSQPRRRSVVAKCFGFAFQCFSFADGHSTALAGQLQKATPETDVLSFSSC